MTAQHQLHLTLIPHQISDKIIEQRAVDGYINATAMCRAAGKLFGHYNENAATKAFLDELATDVGIPISGLVQTIKGGAGLQGTWVHPHVAVNLAQWLSPKFAVQVSRWVHEWLSGKHTPTTLSWHLERHMLNFYKIPNGYFSVLQEMTNRLVAPMEAQGYRLPENMMPDITHAKMLCKHLREKHGVDTDALPQYRHTFPDGREVNANLYPVAYLGEFMKLLSEEWFPKQAAEYFRKRDPAALAALDRIMLIGYVKPAERLSANKPRYRRKPKAA